MIPRAILEILHAQDAEENSRILEKSEEMKRTKYLERMGIEKEHLERIQKEREHQLIEKRRLQNVLDNEKEQILKDFELNNIKLI